MSLFAEYEPQRAALPRADVEIRDARADDASHLAAIAQERDGGALHEHVARFAAEIGARREDAFLLVATVGGVTAGFARAGVFRPPADAPPHAAPGGWYLGGVIVRPAFRRRGIANVLTTARLARIGERAAECYFFANARNRPSIDLHARLGFVEVTRCFWHPNARFEGGVGILFHAVLPRDAGGAAVVPDAPRGG